MGIVKLQEIQKGLVRLSVHYPEAMLDGEALYSLAQDYYESLAYASSDKFTFALKWVRENCKRWPKIPDFIEAMNEYNMCCQDKLVAIPERPVEITEEEAERNKQIAKIYGRVVSKEISMEEAEGLIRDMDSCSHTKV